MFHDPETIYSLCIIFGIISTFGILTCIVAIFTNYLVIRLKGHLIREHRYEKFLLKYIVSHPELAKSEGFQKIVEEANDSFDKD